MYIIPSDARIICSDEVRELEDEYERKFGEFFLAFNYVDFPSKDGKCAAEVYKEALRKAVERDEPTRIVSHRFDTIEH